ncbi:MAG: hypothetical protein ACUVV0_15860 [Anaerolineae bacterium]
MVREILNIDKQELSTKGEHIYALLRSSLEPQHRGEFIAIEPESGEYFLGKRAVEALKKARQKYPHRVFYLARIGFPSAAIHY